MLFSPLSFRSLLCSCTVPTHSVPESILTSSCKKNSQHEENKSVQAEVQKHQEHKCELRGFDVCSAFHAEALASWALQCGTVRKNPSNCASLLVCQCLVTPETSSAWKISVFLVTWALASFPDQLVAVLEMLVLAQGMVEVMRVGMSGQLKAEMALAALAQVLGKWAFSSGGKVCWCFLFCFCFPL